MRIAFTLALAIAIASASGCASGPRTIRSEPPGVQLEHLRLDEQQAHLGLIVHNRNDHPIQVRAIGLAMTVAGEQLVEDRWSLALEIGPRVRERVRLQATPEAGGARSLAGLDGQPDASARYRLRTEIELVGQRAAERQREGFLHPVPGQAGSYR